MPSLPEIHEALYFFKKEYLALFLAVSLWIVAMQAAGRLPARLARGILSFAANAGLVYYLFFYPAQNGIQLILYIIFLGIHYVSLKVVSQSNHSWLVPFLLPIAMLAVTKYLLPFLGVTQSVFQFIGISYMAFRLSYLVIEIRNQQVNKPSLPDYFNFSIFFPTFLIGPINTYERHAQGPPGQDAKSLWNYFMRVVIGLGKYNVICLIFYPLTFKALWFDGHYHSLSWFVVSCIAFYLYLYFNFSGFCDMMIGLAGLAGYQVNENFDAPLKSRNIKEFWNRWHITLSQFIRDVLFTPLTKYLVAKWGPSRINHSIAISILVVFTTLGVWHGYGLHYLLFGLHQSFGLIVCHYFTVLFKKANPSLHKKFKKSKVAYCFSWTLTFLYLSSSFFLFQNSFEQIKTVIGLIDFSIW